MDALRLPPGDAKCGPLSGGECRRVALCKLLLEKLKKYPEVTAVGGLTLGADPLASAVAAPETEVDGSCRVATKQFQLQSHFALGITGATVHQQDIFSISPSHVYVAEARA